MMLDMLKQITLLSICLVSSASVFGADNTPKLLGKDLKETRPIPAVPPVKDVPLDPELQTAARTEIAGASVSENVVLRALVLELGAPLLKADMKADIIHALDDAEPSVRFNATIAVGDIKLAAAKENVLKLANDADPLVRVAVRYALHRLGDFRLSHDLEKLSLDPDPEVRGNTAIVLGKIGAPSAAKILWPMQKDIEPAVRLRVAEALWKLGQDRGRESLVAASISAYPDDIIIAYTAMAATKNEKLQAHIYGGLNHEYPEVALAAARALGDLGSDLGYGVALEGAKSKEPRHRYMAALALGSIHRADAQETLAELIKDKTAVVRLAAAYAVLQLAVK